MEKEVLLLKNILSIIDENQKIILVYKDQDNKLCPYEYEFGNVPQIFLKKDLISLKYDEIMYISSMFIVDKTLIMELV